MGQTSANTSLIHTRPSFRVRDASTSVSPEFQLLPRATNNNDIATTGSDDDIISSSLQMNLAPSNSISSLAESHVSHQYESFHDQPSPPAATEQSEAAAATVTPAVAAACVANNTHNNDQVFPSLLHSQPESEPASLFPFPETEKQHDFPIEEMDESLPPPDYLADATLLENN